MIYFSLNILTSVPLFTLKPSEFHYLTYSLTAATLIAAFVFYIFPGEAGFVRTESVRRFQAVFDFLYTWDEPHNLYPSLHIAYSSICVFAINSSASIRLKTILNIWLVLICISVLLVHQHHVFDVITGLALGYFCHRMVFLKTNSILRKSVI